MESNNQAINVMVLNALANSYISLHFLDLSEDKFTEMKAIPQITQVIGTEGTVSGNFEKIMRHMSHAEYKESVADFIDVSTLSERMHGKVMISHEFLGNVSGWCRIEFYPLSYSETGELSQALFAVKKIEDEKKREFEYRSEIEKALEINRVQNEELKKAENAAKAASKAKSDFISNMSHEIRTPINAVLGMNEMILRDSKDAAIIEYAEDIQTAGTTLLGLVNDILDFSKIESGKMEIVCCDYELFTLIHDTCSLIQDRAVKKGLDIVVNTSPDMPSAFFGDDKRIRQILVNLLTNAVKYTEKGTITLTAYTEIIGDKPSLCFSVKDTGIGIAEEDLKKLFDSFQRADLQHNKSIEGTGLGLAITKQLVSLMDGTVSVSSTYGRGSEFVVKIPQKVTDYTPVGVYDEKHIRVRAEKNMQKQHFIAPDARILVVDDVSMNLKVVKAFLNNTQITVDTAESGQKCIEMVKENNYDIIFMDYMMPVMDGVETFRQLLLLDEYNFFKPPVIMLTANAVSGVAEELLSYGFADYLTKPIDSNLLNDAIIRHLPKELVTMVDEDGTVQVEDKSDLEVLAESVTGMDTQTGFLYCCEDMDFYHEMLNEYCASDRLKNINVMYSDGDWKNYTVQVHSLKSTSLTIGLADLSEMAKGLELASKSGDIDYIRANHNSTVRRYIQALDEIRSYLKNANILHS